MARISVSPSLRVVVLAACLLTSALTALVWWSGAPGYSAAQSQRDLQGKAERHASAAAERVLNYQSDLQRAFTAFAPQIAEGGGNQGAALLGGLGIRRICVLVPDKARVLHSFPSEESSCPEAWPLDLRIRLLGMASARGVTMSMLRPTTDAPARPFLITRAYDVLVVGEISPSRLTQLLDAVDPSVALELIDPAGQLLQNSSGTHRGMAPTRDIAVGRSGWVLRAHATVAASGSSDAARGQVAVLLLASGALSLLVGFVVLNGFLKPLRDELAGIERLAKGQDLLDSPRIRAGAAPREAINLRRFLDLLSKRLERQERRLPQMHPSREKLPDGKRRLLAPPAPRTLIVDPNPAQARALIEVLTSLGARADLCETGREAETRLKIAAETDTPFGLLLVNATLPDMPSAALLRRLSERYPGPAIEILGMASPAQKGELARDLQPGLVKPVDREALVEVFAALGKKRAAEVSLTPADPHALVFDADLQDPSALTLVLDEFDLGLRLVSDATTGLEALEEGPLPDIVLVDISMPGLSGVSTIRRIATCRSRSGDPTCRIIAMSPNVSDVVQRTCIAAGAETVLLKPLQVDRLRECLARKAHPLTQSGGDAARQEHLV